MFSLETARSLHDWVHYFVLVATLTCIMAAFAILWPSSAKKLPSSDAGGAAAKTGAKAEKSPPAK